MKAISSRDNPMVKRLHALANSARERRKLGETLLDGAHPHAATAALADTLRRWGHQVDARAQTSGMATLLRQAASPTGAPRWQAGVDPRRDGLALGGALR